jgi:hypothetical protein
MMVVFTDHAPGTLQTPQIHSSTGRRVPRVHRILLNVIAAGDTITHGNHLPIASAAFVS